MELERHDDMFKTSSDFKIGKLNRLKNQTFKIVEEEDYLRFCVEAEENGDIYSLDFVSTIPFYEMLKFDLNEHIDFIKYVDDGDIVLGKNGLYDLNTEIKMGITRYLPNSFLLVIYFKNRDNLVGYLELSFSFENDK